ncbi:MAG: hypothetical protein V5804_05790 [Mucilaginibacter sp.]|uniref:hypothetical protein n=1 Tax=Mucilaginibacter sp. TaxID=1882438 RepID=UPI0034E53789
MLFTVTPNAGLSFFIVFALRRKDWWFFMGNETATIPENSFATFVYSNLPTLFKNQFTMDPDQLFEKYKSKPLVKATAVVGIAAILIKTAMLGFEFGHWLKA